MWQCLQDGFGSRGQLRLFSRACSKSPRHSGQRVTPFLNMTDTSPGRGTGDCSRCLEWQWIRMKLIRTFRSFCCALDNCSMWHDSTKMSAKICPKSKKCGLTVGAGHAPPNRAQCAAPLQQGFTCLLPEYK